MRSIRAQAGSRSFDVVEIGGGTLALESARETGRPLHLLMAQDGPVTDVVSKDLDRLVARVGLEPTTSAL